MSTFPGDCPLPHPPGEIVTLAHGEGGRATRRLVRDLFLPAFDNDWLRSLADAAVLPEIRGRPAATTDSFVVSPLVFPGGDIGSLAVHGTSNDLAVCGAIPKYLTLGVILEEGLPIATLRTIVNSIAASARNSNVAIVAGDTKVVPRGMTDGMFITAAGIGELRPGVELGPSRIQPGDRILVSGTLGDHGMAVLSARERLELDAVQSDSAPIIHLVSALFDAGIDVRMMRDPTRGGLGAVLHEFAEAAGVTLRLDEPAVPVSEPVRGACELLGIDPVFVACEGRFVAVVPAGDAARAIEVLRADPAGAAAAIVGEVLPRGSTPVIIRNAFGSLRVLDEPSGVLLPRIC